MIKAGQSHEAEHDEFRRRQRIVRRLVGALVGMGYGGVAGGLIGGRTGPGDLFNDRRALMGALTGAVAGGGIGFGVGNAANKIVEYTGGDRPQPPRIQIVLPPSEAVAQKVEDAMKQGQDRAYCEGFTAKCAEAGVDPEALVKAAGGAGNLVTALVRRGTAAVAPVTRAVAESPGASALARGSGARTIENVGSVAAPKPVAGTVKELSEDYRAAGQIGPKSGLNPRMADPALVPPPLPAAAAVPDAAAPKAESILARFRKNLGSHVATGAAGFGLGTGIGAMSASRD